MTQTKDERIKLYTVAKDVKCIKCNNIGAVKSFGTYNNTKQQVFHTLGFGGTVPYTCLNCGNTGLIGFSGLEGYKKAFVKIDATLKTRAQLQQEYEAMPIEEHDPFNCTCESCVREQRRRVNER